MLFQKSLKMRTYYLIPDICTYNKRYLMRAEFNNFIINLKCQSLVEGDRFYHQICQNCIGCSNIKSKLSTDNFLLINQFFRSMCFQQLQWKMYIPSSWYFFNLVRWFSLENGTFIHKVGCVLDYPTRSVFYKVVWKIYGAKSAVMQIFRSKFSKTLAVKWGVLL